MAWVEIRHRLTRANRQKFKLVELPDYGILLVDTSLDFIGENCLRTTLLTKLLLDKASPGDVFEIASDNLSAVETIPFMLPNCNCEYLSTVYELTYRKIYVRKLKISSLPSNT